MDSKIDIGPEMGVVSVNTSKTSVEIHGLSMSRQLSVILDHLLCDTYKSCIKLTLNEICHWVDSEKLHHFSFLMLQN